MSATPASSTDLSSTTKVPKLRSSCEDCGNAKVRCDRGQPGCSRCLSHGLICVYGISRKFGKPRRKRLGAHGGNTDSLLCKKQAAWSTGGSENRSIMVASEQQLHAINKHVTGILPAPPSIDRTSSIYQQDQLGSSFITPLSLDNWPELDMWGADLAYPTFSNASGHGRQLSDCSFEPTSKLGASLDGPGSHSCPRGSYELFRDLICPAPFLHAPESDSDTVSANMDQVLHFNSNAINRLIRLLSCSCAKSGHRVMVHASIVSRILIWYQQAAGWTGSSWGPPSYTTDPSPPLCSTSPSSSPPSGARADSDLVSSAKLVQSTGFCVAKVPVSMGTFNIEDDNLQASIRIRLVLSELKKTANLIDLFVSQDLGKSSDESVISLYLHLGVWLKSEHSRTVRILKARLVALDKIIES